MNSWGSKNWTQRNTLEGGGWYWKRKGRILELAVALCHALKTACAGIINQESEAWGIKKQVVVWILDTPSRRYLRHDKALPPRPTTRVYLTFYRHATNYVTIQTSNLCAYYLQYTCPSVCPHESSLLPLEVRSWNLVSIHHPCSDVVYWAVSFYTSKGVMEIKLDFVFLNSAC